MAEIIVPVAFVQAWKFGEKEPNPDWGMKVVENHRKKNGDNYETVGRTYFTVKAGFETKIDFRLFSEGDRVKIVGKQVTEEREYEGKKYRTLLIKATSIEVIQKHSSFGEEQARWASGDDTF